jgi:uncharacterized protein YlxW (UPF0749 family)
MLVTQFRTQGKVARTLVAGSVEEQATLVSSLYDANASLRQEVARLSTQLEQSRSSMSQSDLASMVDELNQLRTVTGLSEVSGPGVQLSISAPLRAEDVMDLANEVRNAGAEALAVNDQRVAVSTSFTNSNEGVILNGVEIRPPYVFSVIGQPDTLQKALDRKGGLLAIITTSHPSAIITLEKRDKIDLPSYLPAQQWKYAQAVK